MFLENTCIADTMGIQEAPSSSSYLVVMDFIELGQVLLINAIVSLGVIGHITMKK